MRDPTQAFNGDMDLLPRPAARPRGGLVQLAPSPETPDTRDKAGAQTGMAIALTVGGVFWTAVGAAAIYFLQH